MDKGLIVKVGVVILALLFLIEPLSMGLQGQSGAENGGESALYTGTANVNATIYSYGALLYTTAPTEFQKTQILANPEVLEMEEVDDGVYRITLRDSAKTREIYSEFKELGITTIAIGQVGLPEEYELVLADGSRIKIHGGYQQLFMEPLLEGGRKVSYLLSVESDGTNTYRILDAKSYYSNVELSGNATIVGANASAYAFTVPWEERILDMELLKEEYGEENVVYLRKDYVVFEPPLSPSETMFLKREYVTYISEASASVQENFTNRSLAEQDFMGRATFPNSSLQIRAREAPNITFEYGEVNTYTVLLPKNFDGYLLEVGEMELPSELEFEANDTATVVFNATVTGDMVLGIMEVYLKKQG